MAFDLPLADPAFEREFPPVLFFDAVDLAAEARPLALDSEGLDEAELFLDAVVRAVGRPLVLGPEDLDEAELLFADEPDDLEPVFEEELRDDELLRDVEPLEPPLRAEPPDALLREDGDFDRELLVDDFDPAALDAVDFEELDLDEPDFNADDREPEPDEDADFLDVDADPPVFLLDDFFVCAILFLSLFRSDDPRTCPSFCNHDTTR